MMNTPEDMLREALGNITTQCQRMSDCAMNRDVDRVMECYDALDRAVGYLTLIEQLVTKTA